MNDSPFTEHQRIETRRHFFGRTAKGVGLAALATRDFWSSPLNPARDSELGRRLYATADLFSNLTRRYRRPEWGIESVTIDGESVAVRTQTVWSSPWVKLTHFSRDMTDMRRAGRTKLEPPVLIVAPLSGHFATLLAGTVRVMLRDHDVYITDWVNARGTSNLTRTFPFRAA